MTLLKPKTLQLFTHTTGLDIFAHWKGNNCLAPGGKDRRTPGPYQINEASKSCPLPEAP